MIRILLVAAAVVPRKRSRAAVLGIAAAATLTGCSGSESSPRTVLQAFDAGDGYLRWSVELGATEGATEPVIVGDTVIVGAPGIGTAAYALEDGRVRWTVPGRPGLPDAVTGDLAVFSRNGRLEARRADTGAVVWTRETPGRLIQSHDVGPLALVVDPGAKPPACATPAAPNEPGVCTMDLAPPPSGGPPPPPKSEVSLLDPATGKDLWKVLAPGRVDPSASAVSTRHVLATYRVDYSGGAVLAALGLQDGTTAWSLPASSVSYVTSADGIPAVVSGSDPARATVFDPATGQLIWESPAGDQVLRRAPFLQTVGGAAHRRDPRSGAELPGRVPITYGLAAWGDLLVGATNHTLTAIRGADELWSATLPGGARPISYLDITDEIVVALTGIGQERTRD